MTIQLNRRERCPNKECEEEENESGIRTLEEEI
jgi:hypothetical protein